MAKEQSAIFGGGCFWCIEAVFQRLTGVTHVESGYMGGRADQATYRQVCGGDTGHVEVVRVTFDPDQINYRELLDVFFAVHDATTNTMAASRSPPLVFSSSATTSTGTSRIRINVRTLGTLRGKIARECRVRACP